MSRNTEFRFGSIPQINIKRSVFKMRKNVKGTFNMGYLIPFYVNQDILPGDTFKIKQSIIIRMLTPIYPTMDNLVLDTYFFSEPYRRTWDLFKKFMGENESGAWAQTTEYEIPQVYVPSSASGSYIPGKNTIWDYMGLATGIKSASSNKELSVSALPFRGYVDIYNYFFRNENLIAPLATGHDQTGTSQFDHLQARFGGKPLKASRLPDYLSSCLPGPQKGAAVKIPLGTEAPVFGNGKAMRLLLGSNAQGNIYGSMYGIGHDIAYDNASTPANVGTEITPPSTTPSTHPAIGLADQGSNVFADLSQATAATINALRLAFQTQKILEFEARNGTRYFDEILAHFGVQSGAALYEKPRYLGGKRIPLVMNQVAQTSAQTTGGTPMGNVGAFSLTADVDHVFTQSFTEHSILYGIMVVRYLSHTYQQAIPRQWSRKRKLDFYWPELAHLGEQPVLNKEIYAQGTSTDEEVFGYQERWAEYKYENNVICGELKSTYSTPLDAWHYGDKYTSLPVLSQNWIEETDSYLNRTLAVQNHDQFLFDTDLTITRIAPIPTWCYPGLIDHF